MGKTFLREEILGLESGAVRVVPYDPAWVDLYNAEVARLSAILSSIGLSLVFEHMGSTAVPGLAAKPIVDILAGRHGQAERKQSISAFETAGYSYRGEQGIPNRDFFRRGMPRRYHVHLTDIDSRFWEEHLAFRDYLRAHPGEAVAYARLKYELATQHPRDREAYISGKTSFVYEILAKAGI